MKLGTAENQSFVANFCEAMEKFDTLSGSIVIATVKIHSEAEPKLDTLIKIIEKSSRVNETISLLLLSF